MIVYHSCVMRKTRLMTRSELVPIDLPVRLQCIRVPVEWRSETKTLRDDASMTWFLPKGNQSGVSTYDPWEMRKRFFRIKDGDTDAAIELLDAVGLFDKADAASAGLLATMPGVQIEPLLENSLQIDADDGMHLVSGAVLPTLADAFWILRRDLLRQMTKRAQGFDDWDYTVRLVNLPRPSIVITTTAFADAMVASVRIDELRGARFIKCKRKDCGVVFAAVGPRKRKFCEWGCGHLESVRNARARARHGKRDSRRRRPSK